MGTADQYASWIVANQDKRGTPEFETVAAAYKQARSESSAPAAVLQAPTVAPQERSTIGGAIGDIAAGALRGASSIGSTIIAPFEAAIAGTGQSGARAARKYRLERVESGLKELGADTESLPYQGGKIATEVAGTLGVGPSAPAAGLFGRMAQGAVSAGAGTAMVSPEDTWAGIAFGVAMPPAMELVGKAGKTIYNVIEPFIGKGGAERTAARVAGKVAEGEGQKEEIINLLRNAKQGQTAQEAVLPANNAEFMALQNLVGQTRPSLKAAVDQARNDAAKSAIDEIAGTPEMMQRVIERRRVRTEPMRQAAMGAANVADTKGAQLADEIAQKRESMIQAMRGQPALLSSLEQKQPVARGMDVKAVFEGPQTEAAQSAVRSAEGKPGWISNADRAKEWQSAADDLSAIAGQRRQEGAFKQMQLDSIRAYGMKPLDVDAIQSSIASKMKAPGGGIGIDAKVLEGVGNEINRIKALKGRVYPEDLHEIRKKGINDVIESLNTGAPGSTDKRAAQVAGELRNKIDEVLDEASGGMWSPYLASFQRLSRMKDAMETGRDLSNALTGRFGNERIAPFGTALRSAEEKMLPESGRTAIEALYPRQRSAVERVAQQFEDERRIGELVKSGSPEALRVMRATELPGTAPGMISWKVTALNKILNALEHGGGIKSDKALAELMLTNPQKLGELMSKQGEPMLDPMVKAIIERQAAIAASGGYYK